MNNKIKKKAARITLICILAACLPGVGFILFSYGNKPDNAVDVNESPRIFPDYKGATIPVNIAPLNFRIEEEVKSCYAVFAGTNGESFSCSGKKDIRIKPGEWKKLLADNVGQSVSITIYTRSNDGKWASWQPFTLYVSGDPIDNYLVYRLIEPGYEKWHITGIYQRNLETFTEKPLVKNDMTDYNCINCHSFCGGNPLQMMLHMRAANSGTYIINGENIQKLNTQTEQTISHLTYPYWHPSGKYLAASVNDVKQFFHAVKDLKMEVFDLESDVVVYDIENKAILSAASLITKDAFETFPSFSPDGKSLYYCSAPALPMPEQYDSIRYAILRVAFDEARRHTGTQADTIISNDKHSASFPRISPDGRFLMYTETGYGQFPVWHKDAEIRMIDLAANQPIDMSALNSNDTESYHSWSTNSRWVVVSSRRDNGVYTLPYFAHIDAQGNPSKPFVLPQEYPDTYDYSLYSYNLPELVNGEVTISPYAIQHAVRNFQAEQVVFR
jgi:Tol biopolymer transport system component